MCWGLYPNYSSRGTTGCELLTLSSENDVSTFLCHYESGNNVNSGSGRSPTGLGVGFRGGQGFHIGGSRWDLHSWWELGTRRCKEGRPLGFLGRRESSEDPGPIGLRRPGTSNRLPFSITRDSGLNTSFLHQPHGSPSQADNNKLLKCLLFLLQSCPAATKLFSIEEPCPQDPHLCTQKHTSIHQHKPFSIQIRIYLQHTQLHLSICTCAIQNPYTSAQQHTHTSTYVRQDRPCGAQNKRRTHSGRHRCRAPH